MGQIDLFKNCSYSLGLCAGGGGRNTLKKLDKNVNINIQWIHFSNFEAGNNPKLVDRLLKSIFFLLKFKYFFQLKCFFYFFYLFHLISKSCFVSSVDIFVFCRWIFSFFSVVAYQSSFLYSFPSLLMCVCVCTCTLMHMYLVVLWHSLSFYSCENLMWSSQLFFLFFFFNVKLITGYNFQFIEFIYLFLLICILFLKYVESLSLWISWLWNKSKNCKFQKD